MEGKNRKAAVAAMLLLSGCVMHNLGNRLPKLVGQDIHVAIGRLGYPNEKPPMVVGDTVYTWVTDIRAPFPCKVELVATPAGIVKTWSLEGTPQGCERYNDALDD